MTTNTTRIAARLFEVLVDEIRSQRPELLEDGFTVAEIYQNLVPYRTHRDRIGVEMNGDYEHALLRLLAGEGEYLEVGSEAARRRFREELESVRPETGIYRKFAAVEVRVNEDRLPPGLDDRSAPEGVPAEESAAGPPDGSPPSREEGADADPVVGDPEGTRRPAADLQAAPSSPAGGPRSGSGPGTMEKESPDAPGPEELPDTCPWCRERLPDRPDLRFCPYCGSRAELAPCRECGAELEDDWLFCPACGAEVDD